MKAIMTGVALAALIAGAPALAAEGWQQVAQADQQPAQSQDMQAAPACPEGQQCPDATAPDATAPAATGSLPAQPGTDDSAAMQSDEPQPTIAAQSGGKFIDEQDDSTVLASELTGQTVYDAAGTSLGDINDILWTQEGNIQGVVVGVGGFLGIGEKSVAVNFDALNITTDENGDKKLVLDATADELAAAPEFVTTEQKLAELRAQQPPVVDQGAGGLTPVQPAQPAPAQ